MKYRLKSTASVIKHNGKEYGPGEKIDLSEKDAKVLAHHLEEGDELVGPAEPKQKDLDDPGNLG